MVQCSERPRPRTATLVVVVSRIFNAFVCRKGIKTIKTCQVRGRGVQVPEKLAIALLLEWIAL